MLEAPRPQATQLRWDVRICSDAPTPRLPREVHTAFPEYPIMHRFTFLLQMTNSLPVCQIWNRANYSSGKGLPTKGGAWLRSEQYNTALPANSGATKEIPAFYKLGRRIRFGFWQSFLCLSRPGSAPRTGRLELGTHATHGRSPTRRGGCSPRWLLR